MNSTPPGPPPCLPPFQCVKVEEWLKSSEKTKVKLICTPHRSPLQKITTQKTRTSLTLQFPHKFPLPHKVPPKLTHSSTSTAQTRNSPTLQLLPRNPQFTHSSTFYMVCQTWPFHIL